MLTQRAEKLITRIILNNIDDIKGDIRSALQKSDWGVKSELDLRWYAWKEDSLDVSKMENNHTGWFLT